MLWYLLAAVVVVLSLAVLAGVLLGGWRQVKALTGAVRAAGDVVAEATADMAPALDAVAGRGRPATRQPVRDGSDGARLAARVLDPRRD